MAGDFECEVNALGGIANALYARARIGNTLEYFRRCVAIAEQEGWVGIQTLNRCMAAVCLWPHGDLRAGISAGRTWAAEER